MRILFLAPQPFFQERGTPIAVRLALEVIAKRASDKIDLLTYAEGVDVEIPNVNVHRIWTPKWLQGIGPGVSWKKLLCDVIFAVTAFALVFKARSNQYRLVHAVEEAAFVAWVIERGFGVPYIYDMDSSLSLQITEKWRLLKVFKPIFEYFERTVVKRSMAVVPVCDALAVIANDHGSRFTTVLRDISLLDPNSFRSPRTGLRAEAQLPDSARVALYIGNLEPYQGIDLLLESVAFVAPQLQESFVVIIGGREDHIEFYKGKAFQLGIASKVRFLGTRPVSSLNEYLLQATVLLSPRVQGNNTPMKIYSYLHAGVPILATNLPTHTQVLTSDVALLRAPVPKEFGPGMLKLLTDLETGKRLGEASRTLAEQKYTFERFQITLNQIYDKLCENLEAKPFAVNA